MRAEARRAARRAALVRACRERFDRSLAERDQFHGALREAVRALPSGAVERVVELVADDVDATLQAYRVAVDVQAAAAPRLAREWSLWTIALRRPDDVELRHFAMLEDSLIASHLREPLLQWPSNVSLDDVRRTIERARDPAAKVIAASMARGEWFVASEKVQFGIVEIQPGVMQLRKEAFRFCRYCDVPDVPPGELPPGVAESEADFAAIEDRALREAVGTAFHPSVGVLVAWAVRVVQDDQARARAFALPSTRPARVAFDVLARQRTLAADDRSGAVQPVAIGGSRLVWDGKPRGEQLAFGFAQVDVSTELALGIKHTLGAEGLRDYLVLHRLAAAQGRTGSLVWTWEAHKAGTAHARRVRASQHSDDETRDGVVERIRRLARAELHVEVERDGRRAWQVVGGDPLVVVEGGVGRTGGPIEGLKLRLNRTLYAGAEAATKRPHYTMIPEAVLRLDASSLCLATTLVFAWRAQRDTGGVVELSRERVLRLMDEHELVASRHRERATAKVRRCLDAVIEAMGDGCAWEPIEGEKVRVRPPHWWTDHVVLGAPTGTSALPTPTSGVPRRGIDLVQWRRDHGLTQAAAAAALGVSERTIRSAESRDSEPLPRAFAAVRSWVPPRALRG